MKSGRENRRLKAVSKDIHALALSTDGSHVVSLSTLPQGMTEESCNICQLWDLETGKEVFQLSIGGDSLVISPDGKTLASGQSDAIHLWEVATGKERRRFEGHRYTAYSLAFSADGRLLASGGSDGTALVWDVTSLSEEDSWRIEYQDLWELLASPDAARAYRAMCYLIADRESVSFLRKQLHPIAIPDRARIARLVTDLDSDRFPVRDRATRELEEFGELAEPALRRVLANPPSLEMRRRVDQILQKRTGPISDPKRLQQLRGVEALEYVGTPAARRLLVELAGGASEARLTQESKASLARLVQRP